MHEHSADLAIRKIQPVLPDVAIFNVPVFLYLEVIGDRRKIPPVRAKDAPDSKQNPFVRRHVGRIVNRVGQNARLLGLALLINPQESMAEHGGGVVHKGGGENEGNGLRVELPDPSLKSFTPLGGQASGVDAQLLTQPVIASHERALRRLA